MDHGFSPSLCQFLSRAPTGSSSIPYIRVSYVCRVVLPAIGTKSIALFAHCHCSFSHVLPIEISCSPFRQRYLVHSITVSAPCCAVFFLHSPEWDQRFFGVHSAQKYFCSNHVYQSSSSEIYTKHTSTCI